MVSNLGKTIERIQDKAIERGLKKGIEKTAKKAIEMGMNNEIIMDLTGLSEEQINAIRKENSH